MVEDEGARQIIKALFEWARAYASQTWFVMFALWGATASYAASVMAPGGVFSWKQYLLKLLISGFSGLCMAYILEYSGVPFPLIAAGAGMAGYMGDRMLALVESYIVSKSSAAK